MLLRHCRELKTVKNELKWQLASPQNLYRKNTVSENQKFTAKTNTNIILHHELNVFKQALADIKNLDQKF